MKKTALLLLLILSFSACNQNHPKAENETKETVIDNTTINVYYFHGKQRCKTCIAVGEVAKETVDKLSAEHPDVKFTEILTHEKEWEELVEKYQISWNALIIVKGDHSVDITEQAFASAVNHPGKLADLIKLEIEALSKI